MVEFSIHWWVIPTLITTVGILWALFIYDDGGGYLSGLGNFMMLVPVLFVSMLAWIIAAIFK